MTRFEILSKFLAENYVTDDSGRFALTYSPSTLEWMLKRSVSLCSRKEGEIVSFISAEPLKLFIFGKQVNVLAVNLLCVKKDCRNRGLTKRLIEKLTVKGKEMGLSTAIFASQFFPNPICEFELWNRPLNPKKLMKTGFQTFDEKLTFKRAERLFALPTANDPSFRAMKESDLTACWRLFENEKRKFDVSVTFSEEEFGEKILPTFSFVREENGTVTEFFSFYETIVTTSVDSIKTANAFYFVAIDLPRLLNSVLAEAKKMGFDLFTMAKTIPFDDSKFTWSGVKTRLCGIGFETVFSPETTRIVLP